MKNNRQPLLSIGMIVKNEERCIERCLRSLQPLRERISLELVIADTGSTDKTREIAEKYADVLFDFPWINDFSAARNAGMERCTGKWFMQLDADEWFEDDFDQLVEFLETASDQYTGASINIRNYKGGNHEEAYTDFFAARIVRMDSNARYHGVIHEILKRPDGKDTVAFLINETILHHDGYALEQEAQAEKYKRNLELIRKERKKNPTSLLRIVQQIESSTTSELDLFLKLAQHGIELLRKGKATDVEFAPVLYCRGIYAATELKKTSFAFQWIAEMEMRFPKSMRTQIDAQAFGLLCANESEEYQKAAKFGQKWAEGIARFDQGIENQVELRYGIFLTMEVVTRASIRVAYFLSLCHLKRWEEAIAQLELLDIHYLDDNNWRVFVKILFQFGEHFPNLEALLQRAWDVAVEQGAENAVFASKKNYLLAAMNRQYDSKKTEDTIVGMHKIIASLKDCTPGYSARCLMAETAEAAEQELAQITEWDELFSAAAIHAMRLGAAFPEPFYARPYETLEQVAVQLGQFAEDFPAIVKQWESQMGLPETANALLWQFNLAIVALQKLDWEKGEADDELLDQFLLLAEILLNNFYNTEMLNERDIMFMPALQRYGWYLIQVRNAMRQGETQNAIDTLRAASKCAPWMKAITEYMADKTEQQAKADGVSEEMRALAAQVQAKIDELKASNSPELEALLNSPAYAKISPFLKKS